MNPKKSNGLKTVFWWVMWIALTILSFFASAFFWTPVIARHLGPIRALRTSIFWIAAVFGTWLLFLIPLIIIMYAKVDKAYEDARIRRDQNARRFRSLDVPRSKRLLPSHLAAKLNGVPPTIDAGHLVSVILKNGRRFPYVFIGSGSEILGIYDQSELPFSVEEVEDIEPELMKAPPKFLAAKWLRLDGVAAQRPQGTGLN